MRFLAVGEAAVHDLVHGELLIGDVGGRKKLLDDYDKLFQAASIPHRDVVAFVEMRNLNGRGIGWIDIHLLASALVSRLKLSTPILVCQWSLTSLGLDIESPINPAASLS
jgi:hypothetical protein